MFLRSAVILIEHGLNAGIAKNAQCQGEPYLMFVLVRHSLRRVPFKVELAGAVHRFIVQRLVVPIQRRRPSDGFIGRPSWLRVAALGHPEGEVDGIEGPAAASSNHESPLARNRQTPNTSLW